MKTLILATPRSGSHAFSSLFKNNFSEVMNIEDLLLPRIEGTDEIDIDICSHTFLDALNSYNWVKAYFNKPFLKDKHFLLTYDIDLQKIKTKEYPTLSQFTNEHLNRWQRIKKLKNWTVKLIEYQGVPNNIVDEMISQADKVVALKRRDLKAQALSLCVTNVTQKWHGSSESIELDYNLFQRCLQSILQNNKWVDSFDVETIYYEDLDLSKSKIKKNNNKIDYDEQTLNQIYVQTINS